MSLESEAGGTERLVSPARQPNGLPRQIITGVSFLFYLVVVIHNYLIPLHAKGFWRCSLGYPVKPSGARSLEPLGEVGEAKIVLRQALPVYS
ncbi:uncharacterized protein BJX67DRAFT_366874 [Aspergillus lucknowensis]|uniref:Uncharacterized protein n=1 Tax=Aspergillus lucknowensis TaxID=176173 RepID=A0ABR4LA01_9EURO